MDPHFTRRSFLQRLAGVAAALGIPGPLLACNPSQHPAPPDQSRSRLAEWSRKLASEGLSRPEVPLGRRVSRVGELAGGSPYEPFTLDAYLRGGGSPAEEPLTLSLTRFDCVTLVEACLAVSRVAGTEAFSSWDQFGGEVERMRYRDGRRKGYTSRLHYFSEWISDGA